MKSLRLAAVVAVCLLIAPVARAGGADVKKKEAAVAAIEKRKADLTRLSDQVWAYAETALREHKSAKLLADYAEQQGFTVTRGVAGMPTAFVASYGSGAPVIGIMGEYDALPGISQKAQPTKEPLLAGAGGHGCGHNMFGAASLGAAIAIKEMIAAGQIKGTVKFFGTPAEEAVGGKVYMIREGVFKGVDVMLAWHPADETRADTESTQAIVDFIVEFRGKAAHAAADPWNGRSALDGVELFLNGVNMLREHVRPTVRMHYTIPSGGDVPNVIPEYARVWMWVRDSKRAGVEETLGRVREVARGAAIMAGVESTLTIKAGDYEMLNNMVGARALDANLRWLGPITYTEAEQNFAREIQRATGKPLEGVDGAIQPLKENPGPPEGGSTDVGDVSWVLPTLHFSLTTAPKDTPWHSWAVVAAGGMSIGHKGMMHASKTLAITMVDLFEDAELRRAIRTEFDKATGGHVYQPYIPPGPPPLPKD